jgi:hypothetical protein
MMNQRRWLCVVVIASALTAGVVYRAELGLWLGGDHRAPPRDERIAFYTCSMDPSVEADHQGTCPICGMALTPVTKEDRTSGIVRISAAVRQRIGVRVVPVEARPLRKRAVASGQVEHAPPGGRATVAARIYRRDAIDVQPGQPVAVTTPALPVTQLSGTIVTAGELRIAVDNPEDVLRPGMQVDVEIDVELPPRLVVPAQAVIHAGPQRIVFVDRGSGRFEPRTPALGDQAMGLVEVLDGLAAGDAVVVEGTFLLAAESRIRSDGALWNPAPPTPPRRPEQSGQPAQPERSPP